MLRRDFVRLAGGAALGAIASPVLGPIWAARADGPPARLIVVMLRGAVDGLNVVVPYAEAAYYEARSTIAIQRPGTDNGALDLDGHFGLHPALQPLMAMWNDEKLAFIHAAGSPDPSRSHFDAQLFMENGTPGRSTTPDGWMDRLLAALPGPRSPTEAVSVGPTLPYIFKGPVAVANLPLGPKAAAPMVIDRPEIASAFDKLYDGNDKQSEAYRQGRAARTQLVADMSSEEQRMADNGAPPAEGFPGIAARLARLVSQDKHVRLAFVSLGGWDTHARQGNDKGQLAGRLKALAEGLVALQQSLGQDWSDTVLAVISEFGRTVHENGNGGTDHGHGNVIWVMGGPVKGGKVYGQWPGLAAAQLYQQRDLAITTDFRHPLATIVEKHLRLDDKALAKIFPDMPSARGDFTDILAG
ncbi:MAG TPA: DUF1501 domain-containing protein [Stellaceae bacterium]|nr:DUF1501 domain-containing protein [Stellaceae bacterium]